MYKNFLKLLMVFVFSCSQNYESDSAKDESSINVKSKELEVIRYNSKEASIKVIFPNTFEYDLRKGDDEKLYRRYKADSSYRIPYEEGLPELLNKTFWFQIPNDAKNIDIKLSDLETKKILDEKIDLYPVPIKKFETLKDGTSFEKEIFYKNEKFYSEDAWFPNSNVKILEDSFIHGLRVLKVAVPIMTYNPHLSQVEFYESARVSLMYESNGKDYIVTDRKDPFHKIFSDTVINYKYRFYPNETAQKDKEVRIVRGSELIDENYASSNNFYPEYLIVSARRFDNETSSIHTLANYRATNINNPLNVCIVYLDDIYENYTQTTVQEKIQSFISFVYLNWRNKAFPETPNLKYLVLMGDADYSFDNEDWFLPTWRTGPPDDTSTFTGDSDYACLEGNDYMPDLLLGRIPAQNEEELLVMVNKTTHFETNTPLGVNHYATRVLWLGGESIAADMVSVDATPTRNFLISKSIEIDEFDQNYLFNYLDNDFRLMSNTDLIAYLEDRGYLFVIYNGHGSKNYPGWQIPLSSYKAINNYEKMPALVFSAACNTAWFDNAAKVGGVYYPSNSTGEKWVKTAAGHSVMFFGWTRPTSSEAFIASENFTKSIYENHNYIVSASVYESLMGFSFYASMLQKSSLLGDPALDVSQHVEESTKPDFSIDSLNVTPDEPASLNEEVTITMNISNKTGGSAFHGNINVDLDIYSIKWGMYTDHISNQIVSFDEPNTSITYQLTYPHNNLSSLHLNPVLDPDNEVDELSEFNNQDKHYIKYYPIYVNPSSNTAQYGTKNEPFKDISTAINHTFSMEKDTIYNTINAPFIPAKETNLIGFWWMHEDRMLKIYLEKGSHGNKRILELPRNVIIKGISKDNVSLNDGLVLKGNFNIIDSIKFQGVNQVFPAISIENIPFQIPRGIFYEETYFIRNKFQNWPSYPVKATIDHEREFGKGIYFYNNIFYNNYGTVQYIINDAHSGFVSNMKNNTLYGNQNNVFVNFGSNGNMATHLSLRSNIIQNNGPSLTNKPYRFAVKYLRHNNIDDNFLIEEAYPMPGIEEQIIENFNLDPMFYGAPNFHLLPKSPCIDTGDPGLPGDELDILRMLDPDGSPNDRGAYGGTKAVMRELTITNPVHSRTLKNTPISTNPSYPVTVPILITWNTLTMNSTEQLEVMMSHEGKKGKEVDIYLITENTGILETYFNQNNSIEQYYLQIKSLNNADIFELINFTSLIDGEISSILNNR